MQPCFKFLIRSRVKISARNGPPRSSSCHVKRRRYHIDTSREILGLMHREFRNLTFIVSFIYSSSRVDDIVGYRDTLDDPSFGPHSDEIVRHFHVDHRGHCRWNSTGDFEREMKRDNLCAPPTQVPRYFGSCHKISVLTTHEDTPHPVSWN